VQTASDAAILPDLRPAPQRPTLVLSAVDEDLDAARAAVEFAKRSAPAITLVPVPGPEPRVAPAPSLAPTGDPNQILSFGPMRIRRHLVDTILQASRVVGADPSLLMAVADKESSFSTEVKASTSSATGLFQFIERTWLGVVREFGAKHGLAKEAAAIQRVDKQFVVADPAERARILELRREPYLSSLLAAEMLKRDTLRLERRLGRYLTGGEIYLIHFLGPGGAELFIDTMEEQPGVVAAELLPQPAQANRPIFYSQSGGQLKSLSVAEVHRKFESMIAVRLERYREVKRLAAAAVGKPAPR
jgi:hypothetical protein